MFQGFPVALLTRLVLRPLHEKPHVLMVDARRALALRVPPPLALILLVRRRGRPVDRQLKRRRIDEHRPDALDADETGPDTQRLPPVGEGHALAVADVVFGYPDGNAGGLQQAAALAENCLLYTSPSPRD